MVKKNYLIIAGIAIVGIVAAFFLFQTEEGRIKKQFKRLSEIMSKSSGESQLALAAKTSKLEELFDTHCNINFPAHAISKKFSQRDIISSALHVLIQYGELSCRFQDFNIQIPAADTAEAILTATLTGKMSSGEKVRDFHELRCGLVKIEGEWRFSAIEIVDVLEK